MKQDSSEYAACGAVPNLLPYAFGASEPPEDKQMKMKWRIAIPAICSLSLLIFFQNCQGFLVGPFAAKGANPTLDHLWTHEARFVPVRKLHHKDAAGETSEHLMSVKIVPHGGKWYSLNRRTYRGNPAICGGARFDLQISESSDQGATWSVPLTVGRANDTAFCQITDSSLFFDEQTNQMFLLSQCQEALSNKWDVCLYTADGLDPMNSQWTWSPHNPVIKPGDLWQRICTTSMTCPADVTEEGTPEIIAKRDGWYFITFHGFRSPDGYRGIAKTRDFVSFVVDAPDIAQGPLFTKNDCASLIEGCIGVGHASMLFVDQIAYALVETPTQNLACAAQQRWPVLLARANVATFWSQNPRWSFLSHDAPLLENRFRRDLGCQIQYANLFTDGGATYLSFVLYSSKSTEWEPNAIYKLEWNDSRIDRTIEKEELLANISIEGDRAAPINWTAKAVSNPVAPQSIVFE